jgi:hypothetical protein
MDRQASYPLGKLGVIRIERSEMPWAADAPWLASAFGRYAGSHEAMEAAYRAALELADKLLSEAREALARLPAAMP